MQCFLFTASEMFMNIKEAKQQILNAIQAYLIKDEFGDYRISIEHQRPVFLLGAPGIGKTAIMEQIAQETGVNLVTYSMSHHTRESALGLPVIVHRNYTGADVQISEYTMSEIVAKPLASKRVFSFSMRSTAFPSPLLLQCSSFCSIRFSDFIRFRQVG